MPADVVRAMFANGDNKILIDALGILTEPDTTTRIARIKGMLFGFREHNGDNAEPIIMATLESLDLAGKYDFLKAIDAVDVDLVENERRFSYALKVTAGLCVLNKKWTDDGPGGNCLLKAFAALISQGNHVLTYDLAMYWGLSGPNNVTEWLSKSLVRNLTENKEQLRAVISHLKLDPNNEAHRFLFDFICDAAHKFLSVTQEAEKIKFMLG